VSKNSGACTNIMSYSHAGDQKYKPLNNFLFLRHQTMDKVRKHNSFNKRVIAAESRI